MTRQASARRSWEVFDPRDGRPTRTFRWCLVARLAARLGGLDYARVGDGWPPGSGREARHG